MGVTTGMLRRAEEMLNGPIHPALHPAVSLFKYLSIHPSIFQSVCTAVNPNICPIHIFILPSFSPSVCLYISQSKHLSVRPSVHTWSYIYIYFFLIYYTFFCTRLLHTCLFAHLYICTHFVLLSLSNSYFYFYLCTWTIHSTFSILS